MRRRRKNIETLFIREPKQGESLVIKTIWGTLEHRKIKLDSNIN